jgi:hypothetical protein
MSDYYFNAFAMSMVAISLIGFSGYLLYSLATDKA